MNLGDTLAVVQVSDDVFTGTPAGSGFLFGGWSLGLALNAAAKTVPPQMSPKSLHACFLRPGEAGSEITLHVDRWSEGRSFATRQVRLIQSGRAIVEVVASFHLPGESGEWQASPAPDLPSPETLDSARVFLAEQVIEVRAADGRRGESLHQSMHPYWARPVGPIGVDPSMQSAAVAFMSDYMVVLSMFEAGAVVPPTATIRTVTQTVWFHRDAEAEAWLLFDSSPLSITRGRGFAIGSVHSPAGGLVASFAQEVIVQP
jgi:acyl-CoA thioesterase